MTEIELQDHAYDALAAIANTVAGLPPEDMHQVLWIIADYVDNLIAEVEEQL